MKFYIPVIPAIFAIYVILMAIDLAIGPIYHVNKLSVNGQTKYALYYCPVIPVFPCDRWGMHDTLEAAESDYAWATRPKDTIIIQERIK